MNTKLLRQKILDLAIRGKLTEQKKSDGTTKDLLKQIFSNVILSNAKNPGKSKNAPKEIIPLDKSEAPFEIPENWEWVRLGDICKVFGRIGFRGYTKKDLVENGEGAISLSPSNIDNMKLRFDKCTFISWEKYEESPEIMLNVGDIVVVKTGSSYGKTALVDELPEKTTLNPQLMVLKRILCINSYLCYFLNSAYFRKVFEELVNGTAIPTFSQEKFSSKIFPLPPLAEQQRIVTAIENAFAEITEIENNQELLKKHIKQGRQKILDLAIRGKLTQQLKTDGTTKDLLAQMSFPAPTGNLVTSSSKKKGKSIEPKQIIPLDKTTAPFEIPSTWEWVKLGDIASDFQYGSSEKSKPEGKVAVLRMGNINRMGQVVYDDLVYTSTESEITKYALDVGDVLFNRTNSPEWVGKTALYRGEIPAIYAGYIIRIKPKFLPEYLNYLMCSKYERDWAHEVKTDGVHQSNINAQKLIEFAVPLPPLAEQQRIVATIEQAFAEFNSMEKGLQ